MLDEYDFSQARRINMETTTDKVYVGNTTGTSFTYSPSYNAEKGWECPRCKRINAPWVRQCDCNNGDWTITNVPNITPTPSWQLPTTITCKTEPDVKYVTTKQTSYPYTVCSVDSKTHSDPNTVVTAKASSVTRATSDNPWYQFSTPTISELNTQYCLNQKAVDDIRNNPPRGGSSQQDH